MTTKSETDWPYDADPHDPLTALRIPVVSNAWPRWNYIVAFDLDQIDKDGHRPTDAEAALLRSFLDEYIQHWYRESWITKMAERPFDIDGGANGIVFRKWGPDDWGYRRRTWQYGPVFVPEHPRIRGQRENPMGPLTLLQVMDRINSICDEPLQRWVEWKAAHPDLFGGTE